VLTACRPVASSRDRRRTLSRKHNRAQSCSKTYHHTGSAVVVVVFFHISPMYASDPTLCVQAPYIALRCARSKLPSYTYPPVRTRSKDNKSTKVVSVGPCTRGGGGGNESVVRCRILSQARFGSSLQKQGGRGGQALSDLRDAYGTVRTSWPSGVMHSSV